MQARDVITLIRVVHRDCVYTLYNTAEERRGGRRPRQPAATTRFGPLGAEHARSPSTGRY